VSGWVIFFIFFKVGVRASGGGRAERTRLAGQAKAKAKA
jgi:hypothetical protein